ncbi:hypothetical protein BKA67DRAFT_670359 [Truncatella angustata]|uniref:Uncharacterized protein n=1 Tax=Truncatella angustata TaxID=152316 RepID=A0A9P8RH65_9PEZI|nr:uncharacterized protein BKA67DRAFT_670359 [Truncatella angustata]KAH6645734.1 hypothetical protein BKA67DRAFT_670359 [Truncatella angustata]
MQMSTLAAVLIGQVLADVWAGRTRSQWARLQPLRGQEDPGIESPSSDDKTEDTNIETDVQSKREYFKDNAVEENPRVNERARVNRKDSKITVKKLNDKSQYSRKLQRPRRRVNIAKRKKLPCGSVTPSRTQNKSYQQVISQPQRLILSKLDTYSALYNSKIYHTRSGRPSAPTWKVLDNYNTERLLRLSKHHHEKRSRQRAQDPEAERFSYD